MSKSSQRQLRVGVIFGGRSSEHEVSIRSARTIFSGLIAAGHEVVPFAIDRLGRWLAPSEALAVINNTNISEALSPDGATRIDSFIELASAHDPRIRLDLAFPIIHGTLGEDGALQGFFKLLGLPFVGPDVLGSAVCMDKEIAKILLGAAGIHSAPYECIHASQIDVVGIDSLIAKLGMPLFVKPANQGSSVGVTKVKDRAALLDAIKHALKFDKKVLVETMLRGQEVECSVLGNEEPEASVPGEIVPDGEFYSYSAKYSSNSRSKVVIPVELDAQLTEAVRKIAVETFKVLQCEGMARVDFFVDSANGSIYVNEVNTLPGFTSISMYPKMWEASGMALSELLNRLLELGLARGARDSGFAIKEDVAV